MVPVPLKDTECGLPDALSVTLSVPVRVPAPPGVNFTNIEQPAPAARAVPHAFVCEKFPEVAMLEMFNDALPEFRSVTVCDPLVVFTRRVPNDRDAGESETAALPAGVCVYAIASDM